LEEEIDSAVDRLFVEKRRELGESLMQEPPSLSPPPGTSEVPARSVDLEPPSHPTPTSPSPQPQSPTYLKSIDSLEAQLLSLEWEITDEKLRKTQEAVTRLHEPLNQRADIGSVLRYMESVLEQMVGDEENIQPPMIKFLLDAKETVKLLVREETENEFSIYKQLAREGIEARFTGLISRKGPLRQAASSPPEEPVPEKLVIESKKVEEVLAQWNGFLAKAEGVLRQIDQHLSRLEKTQPEAPVPSEQTKSRLMDITIFKAYGKLYGVESQKVVKLYKIPPSFEEKYAHQPKVRLRDMDVTLIDLKKAFPVESWESEGTSKLLMIQEGGECKGLFVEEVLKRLMVAPEDTGENGKPLLGTIRWTYQAHPVEVLILDPKKL
jgi:chemotaxis protein histidine kinase CheA